MLEYLDFDFQDLGYYPFTVKNVGKSDGTNRKAKSKEGIRDLGLRGERI